MRGVRLVEVIITDQGYGRLESQKRFSMLSWSAGPKRGEVTRSMAGVST